MFRVQAGRQIRGASALNPGFWGDNLFIDIDYDTVDPESLFNLTVSEIKTENGRRTVLRTETFRNLTMEPGAPTNALDVVNAGSRLVQLDRDGLDDLDAAIFAPRGVGLVRQTGWRSPGRGHQVHGRCRRRQHTKWRCLPARVDFPGLRPLLEQAIRSAATKAATDDERALIAGASVRLIGRGTTDSPYHLLIQAGRGGTDYDPTETLEIGGDAATLLGFPPASATATSTPSSIN